MVLSVLTAFDFELNRDIYGFGEHILHASPELQLNDRERLRERERTRQRLQERIQYEERANPDIIGEVLTSAIDDTLFIAYFDTTTGRVSFYNADGQREDWYRYVDGEAGFNELVAINAEVTSEPLDARAARATADRSAVNRNTSEIDVETRMLIEYDEYGNRTETYLSEDLMEMFPNSRVFEGMAQVSYVEHTELTEQFAGIAPLFDHRLWMRVPWAEHPQQTNRSLLVGGGYFNTIRNQHTRVEFWTYAFPAGMQTIDVFITNRIGDCWTVRLSVQPWREVVHNLRFAGEPYGAFVSCFRGPFNNVEMRFFAAPRAMAQNFTITYRSSFHPNGHGDLPANQTVTAGTSVAIRHPSNNFRAAVNGFTFDGWNTSPSGPGTWFSPGETIIMPSHNMTLYARWRLTAPRVSANPEWVRAFLMPRESRTFAIESLPSEGEYMFILRGADPHGVGQVRGTRNSARMIIMGIFAEPGGASTIGRLQNSDLPITITISASEGGNFEFALVPRSYPSFSAFSTGTNLHNLPHGVDPHQLGAEGSADRALAWSLWQEAIRVHPTNLNPAQHFASVMSNRGLSRTFVGLNNNTSAALNPSRYVVRNHFSMSEIVYLATHGSSSTNSSSYRGFWIQDMRLTNGIPYVMLSDNGLAAEFYAPKEPPRDNFYYRFLDDTLPSDLRMNWFIAAACAQLNEGAFSVGYTNALLRNRNAHGMLGYFGTGPGFIRQNDIMNDFNSNLDTRSILDSWERANMQGLRGNSNWAALVNDIHVTDRIHFMAPQDTRWANDRTFWRYSRGQFGVIVRPTSFVESFQEVTSVRISNPDIFDKDVISDYLSRQFDSEFDGEKFSNTNAMLFNFTSTYSFEFFNDENSLGNTGGIAINSSQAIEYAINTLADMSLLPDNYIIEVGSTIRTNMCTGETEVVEYNVRFIPTMNGRAVYTVNDNAIIISITNNGIRSIDYNWVDITPIRGGIRASSNAFADTELYNILSSSYDGASIISSYFITADNEVLPVFEVRDDSGFIISMVDVVSGDDLLER